MTVEMRCQHVGCKATAVVTVETSATLAVRLSLPVSLGASAYSCRRHVSAVAKALAARVLDVGGETP